jgi:glycine/D-amino acid oxidase-like deaminating enzyme
MRIIVVGSGIVGTSVAYRLAQAGASVTVVEERRIGGGTSSTSYAWVNACEKLTSHDYFKLNLAGRAAHKRIAEELDGHDWYPRPGVLQWQSASAEAGGVDTSGQAEKFKQLSDWGYPSELIDGRDLRRLEPELAPEAYGNGPILHYHEDGWCYPVLYAGRVANAARSLYGAVFLEAKVEKVDLDERRCRGVILKDGTRIEADVVVNCAGRWANEIVTEAEAQIPLSPTAGIVAYTLPVGIGLRRGLRTPSVNLRPDGAGRLLLRSGDIDKQIDPDVSLEASRPLADELLRRARALIPALANVALETYRIAIRPQPSDGYSVIGPAPSIARLYHCVTHSGVTLAPFIGEAVTDELMNGSERSELASFRAARFQLTGVQ